MSTTKYPWKVDATSYLAAHPKVVLAFLFGSYAGDRARSDSDIDFAVHLLEPYSEQDVASIWDRLEGIARRDVDLIVLNTAPPGVAWASMKGQALVDKDPRFRLELMLRISREAEDFREFVMSFLHERNRHWRDGSADPIT